MSFFAELKRRNVHRMAGLYLVGAWLVVQVASTVLPAYEMPSWMLRAVITIVATGFIPALIFAWVFEITPEGLKRESEIDRTQSITPHTGKAMDRIIMAVLALALSYFAFDKFVLSPQREAQQVTTARKEGRSEALVESYGDKSIAVLPFVNMSNDPAQEYFSDGIAEELLNLLAKIPALRVISRTSAFSYKGKDIKLAQIAEELNVVHILEGSVRKSGNTIRITAQLIEARSDTQLWSETWDRKLDDIFAVQDEIAAAVVAQLKIKLLGVAPKAKEANPEAYALYLQARQLFRQSTPEGYEQSIALYRQALVLDSRYAAAWNGLAMIYINQAGKGLRPAEEGIALAREAVAMALALDPEYAPAHAVLGLIAVRYDGDLAAAGHYQHALALAPADIDILRSAAALAGSLGRLEIAIALDEYAVAHDPVNPACHGNLGFDYLFARRPDEAIVSYRRALRLSPGYIGAHYFIGEALLAQGQADIALGEMQQEPSEIYRMIGLPMVYYALGRRTESDAALAELIRKGGDELSYNIASVYAFRGQAEKTFEWLEKELEVNGPAMAEVVGNPLFASIESDPHWLPFLRRIGKAPEQLAAIKFDVKLPQQ